jgi:hypothetical protein
VTKETTARLSQGEELARRLSVAAAEHLRRAGLLATRDAAKEIAAGLEDYVRRCAVVVEIGGPGKDEARPVLSVFVTFPEKLSR